MYRTKSLGHEHLDALTNQFIVRVSEQFEGLCVGEPDRAGGAGYDYRVWREIQQNLKILFRYGRDTGRRYTHMKSDSGPGLPRREIG